MEWCLLKIDQEKILEKLLRKFVNGCVFSMQNIIVLLRQGIYNYVYSFKKSGEVGGIYAL